MHAHPTERLSVEEVQRLEMLLGGDLQTQAAVIEFIRHQYGARTLLFLPRRVAEQIVRHPGQFVRAAKDFYESLMSQGSVLDALARPLPAFWALP